MNFKGVDMERPTRFAIYFTREELDRIGVIAGRGNKERFMKQAIMDAVLIAETEKGLEESQ